MLLKERNVFLNKETITVVNVIGIVDKKLFNRFPAWCLVRIWREERGQIKVRVRRLAPAVARDTSGSCLTWAFHALWAWPRTGPGTSDRTLKLEGEAIRGHRESGSGAASGSGSGWS